MAFGHTASEFIFTLVSGVVMPIISVAIRINDWQNDVLLVGSIEIKWGELLKDTIRLIFISFSIIYTSMANLRSSGVTHPVHKFTNITIRSISV